MQDEQEKRKNSETFVDNRRQVIVIILGVGLLFFGIITFFVGGRHSNDNDVCGDLPASQIAIGDSVQVQIVDPYADTAELFIYQRPNAGQRLGTITTQTSALVIAGDECIVNNKSERYWRIQTDDGVQGWVLEIASDSNGYLLLPISER